MFARARSVDLTSDLHVGTMAERRSMGRDGRKEKRRSVKQRIRDTKRLLSKVTLDTS